jgi:2-oxoisovalerate dehydrogenase E1 component
MVLYEDTLTSGFGGEIAAYIGEHFFKDLDAPVMRCASLDTAIPMNKALEDQFLAKARLEEMMDVLLKF